MIKEITYRDLSKDSYSYDLVGNIKGVVLPCRHGATLGFLKVLLIDNLGDGLDYKVTLGLGISLEFDLPCAFNIIQ